MSLSGQDLTEPIAKSGAQIFRLTGFLGDDQSLHGGGRPFARASRDYHDVTLEQTRNTRRRVTPDKAMREPWQLVLLWGVVVGLTTGFVGGYLAASIAAPLALAEPAPQLIEHGYCGLNIH
jgi:hypothetical protein